MQTRTTEPSILGVSKVLRRRTLFVGLPVNVKPLLRLQWLMNAAPPFFGHPNRQPSIALEQFFYGWHKFVTLKSTPDQDIA
jgi:hypothetical protein